MKRLLSLRVIALSLMLAALVALGACSTTTTSTESTRQAENRAYMAEVNQIMDDLQSDLEAFNDAVSSDDLVSMRTQASQAFETIDQLESLEPTEDLEDVHEYYLAGCAYLEEALSLYIELYADIADATDDDPFDYSTYESRLQEIQDAYDSGIEQLEAGDTAAAEKE